MSQGRDPASSSVFDGTAWLPAQAVAPAAGVYCKSATLSGAMATGCVAAVSFGAIGGASPVALSLRTAPFSAISSLRPQSHTSVP